MIIKKMDGKLMLGDRIRKKGDTRGNIVKGKGRREGYMKRGEERGIYNKHEERGREAFRRSNLIRKDKLQ